MKRIHTISSAMLAAAMLLATACSEELMDGDHTAANAVQIATATVGGDTAPQTRADINATVFVTGDAIALSTDASGNNQGTYTKSADGWTLTSPLYWGNAYPVTYYAAYPTSGSYNAFTLPTTQSGWTELEAANYMTATTDEISAKPADGSITLAFAHRTAQVIVKINKQRTAGNTGMLSDAKIYSPASRYTNAAASGTTTAVTPFTATGTTKDDYEAQYTALVIPTGTATGHKLFAVKVGDTELTYTATVNFEANKIYTYTLTIGTDRVVLYGLTVKDWTTTEVSGTMLGYWEDYASTSLSGSGTATDPYQINSEADLARLAKYKAQIGNNKYFKLTKDLDLSGKLWTPIGNISSVSSSFWGKFDGDGYTITGLTVRTNGTYASGLFGSGYYSGLFGCINNSTISNLHLTKVDVRGDSYTGGLCGTLQQSLIYGCTVDGKVSGATGVGGLVGMAADNTNNYLFACGTHCTVVATTSGTCAGGLVGKPATKSEDGFNLGKISVASSYASGTVSGVDGSSIGPLFSGAAQQITGKWCASVLTGEIGAGSATDCQTGVAAKNLKSVIDPSTAGSFTVYQYIGTTSVSKRFLTTSATWTEQTANADRCPWMPGTIADPEVYDVLEIGTKEELKQLAADVNAGNTVPTKVVLTADIDLAGEEWIPIGTETNHMKSSFDGQGHTISNLTINTNDIRYAGLFGWVQFTTGSLTIKNVTLKDAKVSSTCTNSYVGALIGNAYTGYESEIIYIDNCHVTGTSSVAGYSRSGGLVGKGNFCTITRCSSVANVTTTFNTGYPGGLVGEASSSPIYACYATGNVSSTGTYVPGGIVGYSSSKGDISGCYYNGESLTQNNSAAGGRIVGKVYTYTGWVTTLSYCGAPAINGLKFFDKNTNNGTFTYTFNNLAQNVNDDSGVAVSALYSVVANQANTTIFTVDGTTYNVKDCWTDVSGSAPTLKVKADGTTN